MEIIIPLAFSVLLSVIHFFSEKTANKIKQYHEEIMSFSAGLFITYIMLEVLPELTMGTPYLGENTYLLLLIGFTTFHIAEKYVYQHVSNKKELLKDLAHLHIAGFIADAFIVGFALVVFFDVPFANGKFGYLVLIPFLLHTLSSSISVRHIHSHFRSTKLEELMLSMSTTFGTITAIILGLKATAFYAVFSLVTGVLLYVIIRDLVPSNQKGRPKYFLLGMALSLVLIAMAGMPI